MAQLWYTALLLFAVSGAAILTALFFWHPVSAEVKKRVDSLVSGVAGRARESRGDIAAPQSRLLFVGQLFTLGMPRKWGVASRPLTFALAAGTTGAAIWLLFGIVFGLTNLIALPVTVIGAWLGPHLLARAEQGKAEKRFVDLFPEAIDMIVRMLRAGLPVSAAIRTVAREAPAPINGVFAALADQIEIGMSFEAALAIGSERIGLPDFRFFAAAVALQHTTGGNLVATLEILGEIIRRRRAIRMKARAATAEVRMSAYVLGSLPFFVFAALIFVSPNYLTPLITDPRGNVMLFSAFSMLLIAFLSMRHLMRSVGDA